MLLAILEIAAVLAMMLTAVPPEKRGAKLNLHLGITVVFFMLTVRSFAELGLSYFWSLLLACGGLTVVELFNKYVIRPKP